MQAIFHEKLQMTDPTEENLRSGKKPTSFNLEPDLVYKFGEACAIRRMKKSDAAAEAIAQWMNSTEHIAQTGYEKIISSDTGTESKDLPEKKLEKIHTGDVILVVESQK